MKSIYSKKEIVISPEIGIHRLVMEAFIIRKEGYLIADHINEDHTDNRIENLRRTTISGNMIAYVEKRMKEDPYFFYKNRRDEETTKKLISVCKMLNENKLPIWIIGEKCDYDIMNIHFLLHHMNNKDLAIKYKINEYNKLSKVDLDNISDYFKHQVDLYLRNGEEIGTIIRHFFILDENKSFKKWVKDRKNHLITDGLVDGKNIYENEDYDKISELIHQGYRPSVIAEKLGHYDDYIYTKHIAYLRYQIMEKEGFIEFNDEISLKEKRFYSENRIQNQDTKTVHKICQMLEDNKLSLNKIAKLNNVSKQAVISIKSEQNWTNISANYMISNHTISELKHDFVSDEMKKKIYSLLDQGYKPMEICHMCGYHNEALYDETGRKKKTPFYQYVSHIRDIYNSDHKNK